MAVDGVTRAQQGTTGPAYGTLPPRTAFCRQCKDRRLTFLLDVPGTSPREVSVKGTEFDVGPTVAEALGVQLTDPGRIGLGGSLLAGDGFLWTKASGLQGDYSAIYTFTHSDTVRAFVKAARDEAQAPGGAGTEASENYYRAREDWLAGRMTADQVRARLGGEPEKPA